MTPARRPGAVRTAGETAAAVRRGDLTAVESVAAALGRLRETEPATHAFLDVLEDQARERAEEIDRRISRGDDPGPLAGVPVAIKDNLALAGHRLTCGSGLLAEHRAPFTATAVERLLDAGAIVVGKTNLDEFAMGSSGERSAFGPTRNPWDLGRVPGGSSSGSATAVASGVVPLALGSDTGGSVRQPAAFCGAVGLRPTWGRVSRWGLVAFASSMDQVGPLTRTVSDAALAVSVLAGPDTRDATCQSPDCEPEGGGSAGDPDLTGWTLGAIEELSPEAVSEPASESVSESGGWARALDRFRSLGAEIVEVTVPNATAALPAYQVVSSCEASANLARYEGVRYGIRAETGDLRELYVESRSRGFGPEVQRRILLGTFALAKGFRDAYYSRAQGVREALRRQLAAALSTVDVLIAPTAPGGAFRLGERLDDPLAMYGSDRFTVLASLAGLPAVAVPSGLDGDGLPLSVQILGRRFDELRVLRAAAAFERAVGFTCRPALETPEVWGGSR